MSNGKMSWYIKFLFSKDIKVSDLLRFFYGCNFLWNISFILFVCNEKYYNFVAKQVETLYEGIGKPKYVLVVARQKRLSTVFLLMYI